MWDLNTINTINKHGSDAIYARVFALGDSKFALGNRGLKALNVVQRVLTHGKGRPRYLGVRGRRPVIAPEHKSVAASAQLRAALREAL